MGVEKLKFSENVPAWELLTPEVPPAHSHQKLAPAATCADPTFADAVQPFRPLDEQGRSEAAIDCLRRALQATPDYADAMFNLALLLQRSNRHEEAALSLVALAVVIQAYGAP